MQRDAVDLPACSGALVESIVCVVTMRRDQRYGGKWEGIRDDVQVHLPRTAGFEYADTSAETQAFGFSPDEIDELPALRRVGILPDTEIHLPLCTHVGASDLGVPVDQRHCAAHETADPLRALVRIFHL